MKRMAYVLILLINVGLVFGGVLPSVSAVSYEYVSQIEYTEPYDRNLNSTIIITTSVDDIITIPTETTTPQGWYESQYEITIDSLPSKTSYYVGDQLDLSGLKVSLVLYDQHGYIHNVYTSVSPLDYPDAFVVDMANFDRTEVGTYTLKISCTDEYQSFLPTDTITFDVDVIEDFAVTTTTTIVTTEVTGTTVSTENTIIATETTPITTTPTEETTLPQTGYSKWYQVTAALAACMTGIGGAMVIGSGVLKKKRR